MSQRSYLGAIEDAERDLEELKKEQAALLKRIDTLETFIQSGRALTGRDHTAVAAASTKAASKKLPIADQVAEVLKAAGKPLHLKEIADRLRTKRKFAGKDPAESVASAIKRRGGQFKKVKPNTFTLA